LMKKERNTRTGKTLTPSLSSCFDEPHYSSGSSVASPIPFPTGRPLLRIYDICLFISKGWHVAQKWLLKYKEAKFVICFLFFGKIRKKGRKLKVRLSTLERFW
jgi:hypothetical protein